MLCMLACVSLTPHSTMHLIAHPLPCAHRTPPMRAAVRPIPLLTIIDPYPFLPWLILYPLLRWMILTPAPTPGCDPQS